MSDSGNKDEKDGGDAAQLAASNAALAANLTRLEELTRRMVSATTKARAAQPALEGPGQELYMKAASAMMAEMMAHPERMIERQVHLWRDTLENAAAAQRKLVSPEPAPEKPDRVFSNPLWDTNPYFSFVRDQYRLSSKAITESVGGLADLDDNERNRVAFFTQQMVDMLSPANFLATNPDAIEKALATDGASLVDGLENMVRDLEANDGRLAVTLADPDAFKLGENIATAPGKVVFRNRMFELIQYEPTTRKVFETPLVILPPWINKFYILDLKPQNSFIRYAVDQGHTVFVVSWVNPDKSYAKTGFDDYVRDGAMAAIEETKKLTGTKQVNAIGYCIGGTLLASTLALMAKRKDDSVANATFFTTLLDFADPGELGAFLTDDFLEGLEQEVEQRGMLDAFFMARTFSFLRARDLVYGPAVRSYMMGEAPPAFDLLYWNGDSTNLPAAMARDYLRGLYRENRLMKGTFEVDGEMLKLGDIKVPTIAIATRTDHIAPWKSSFSGLSQFSGEKTFILSDSGHIAGIVNPPVAKKYGYWLNGEKFQRETANVWFDAATRHEGSWWPVWTKWLESRSGDKLDARKIPAKTIADAPGTYVAAVRAKA
jgi:polyhydroxyalkanoate synthase